MYVITTSASGWLKDLHTEIRIEFDDDAKDEAIRCSKPGESMLEQCCWRLIHNRMDEVQGEAVTFTVSRADVVELIWQSQQANGLSN